MLKISKRVEYGLLALKLMSRRKRSELITAREICEQYGAPFDTLARTLQILHREKVLEAEHGAQGGYRIGMDLSKLSFERFNTMIVGNVSFVDCMGRDTCDMIDQCTIIPCISLLSQKLRECLSSVSILELIKMDDAKVSINDSKPVKKVC